MTNYIYGVCRTNLDDYKREEWPDLFIAVPRVGERVVAKSGMSLRVVSVSHSAGGLGRPLTAPLLLIELHR